MSKIAGFSGGIAVFRDGQACFGCCGCRCDRALYAAPLRWKSTVSGLPASKSIVHPGGVTWILTGMNQFNGVYFFDSANFNGRCWDIPSGNTSNVIHKPITIDAQNNLGATIGSQSRLVTPLEFNIGPTGIVVGEISLALRFSVRMRTFFNGSTWTVDGNSILPVFAGTGYSKTKAIDTCAEMGTDAVKLSITVDEFIQHASAPGPGFVGSFQTLINFAASAEFQLEYVP